MCIEDQFDGPRRWPAWSFDEGGEVNALESPGLLGRNDTLCLELRRLLTCLPSNCMNSAYSGQHTIPSIPSTESHSDLAASTF